MKKLILTALSFISVAAFAMSGELPFPYDQDSNGTVLENHNWKVENANLAVQLRVYQDTTKPEVQWIKVWVHDDEGFVFFRRLLPKSSEQLSVPVEIGPNAGELNVNLEKLSSAVLVLKGQSFVLDLQP